MKKEIVIFLGVLFFMSMAMAADFSVNPSTLNVGSGQEVSADINIANAKNVFGIQMDIDYDPSVLEFVKIEK